MRIDDLIDPATIRNHAEWFHDVTADSIRGSSVGGVLHLVSMAPDYGPTTSAYCLGDVDHMVSDAVTDSLAGKNVYLELRIVRPGPPEERNRRGGLGATLRQIGMFADSDGDKDQKTVLGIEPTAVIETSPGNCHPWYVFNPAVNDAERARQLGFRLKAKFGGDKSSFVPVQPARLAGTINYPNRKKRERGRTPTSTSIRYLSGPRYTIAELESALPAVIIEKRARPRRIIRPLAHLNGSGAKGYAIALIARPVDPRKPDEPAMTDRSRWFFHCVRMAVFAGMTADEIESVMRDYMRGCAEKYLWPADRLRAEIIRCADKIERRRNRDTLAELLGEPEPDND
jgi:uncharacterized protein CbrC (UPF0167 family)